MNCLLHEGLHDTINVRLTSELRALKSMPELLVAPEMASKNLFHSRSTPKMHSAPSSHEGNKNPVECTTNSDTRAVFFTAGAAGFVASDIIHFFWCYNWRHLSLEPVSAILNPIKHFSPSPSLLALALAGAALCVHA
jgi:hypothetical protein